MMRSSSKSPVALFAHELKKKEPALDRLALYISQIAYPDLEIDEYIAQLDNVAEQVMSELNLVAPGYERAQRFLTIFNSDLNFHGNIHNYYEADNSFLNQVLARRVGLPILLSLVCITIGTRMRWAKMDIDLQGVGLPNHFMVRYSDVAGIWLLDPFYGKVLPPEEVATYLSSLFREQLNGKIIKLPPNILRPVSTQMLLFRVLNNLRRLYLDGAKYRLALSVMDYMIELVSDDPQLWKERGLLNHHCNNLEQASRDLRRYFFLNDQWMVASGIVTDTGLEVDIQSGFLLGSEFLENDGFDSDTTDEHMVANWDEDFFDSSLRSNDNIDPNEDFGEYEYIELTDEEYHLLNVLTDIEELRISLN